MSRTKLIIVGTAGVVALVVFGVVFAVLASAPSNEADRQLDTALKLLDQGRWDLADRIARDLSAGEQITPERNPVYRFVRGAAGVLRTEGKMELAGSRKILWDSIDDLAEAHKLGFPIGYKGKGAYFLGYCYFHTFDWDKAIQVLPEAIDAWPQRRSDAYEMLVQASLKKQPAAIEEAKQQLAKWSSIAGMSDSENNRARLLQAHVATVENDWPECERILKTIPAESQESFEAIVMQGFNSFNQADHIAQSSSATADENFQQAIERLQSAVSNPDTPAHLRRQATFLIGRALRQLKRLDEALSLFSTARQLNPHSPEAIAAAVEEAEIEIIKGKYQNATEIGRHISVNVGDLKLYDQRWMPITELRSRLLELGRQLQAAKNFELTIRLCGYIAAVLPKPDLVRLEAETYEQWADELNSFATNQTETTASQQGQGVSAQARSKYSLAGRQFHELATLELTSPQYPELIWQAIECYRKAEQPDTANQLLPEYLLSEKDSERPRGYLALAENLLNSARYSEALPHLRKCLDDHAGHPSIYEARLLTSRVYNELDRIDEASDLLLSNLYDGNLHPESAIWRDSLFELGFTLCRQGERLCMEAHTMNSNQAAEKLDKLKRGHDVLLSATKRQDEAVNRYGEDPRSASTLYSMGNAFSQAATYPKEMLVLMPQLSDSEKRALHQQQRILLDSALNSYVKLRENLIRSQEQAELSPTSLSLLRNGFFGEADTLFELKRYEEAIQAYRNVGNRFMNQPESLEALVQISQCYRQLGQPEQAKRILTQAEQVLGRIPAEQDPRFAQVTRSTRDQWPGLLGWLKQM